MSGVFHLLLLGFKLISLGQIFIVKLGTFFLGIFILILEFVACERLNMTSQI